MDETNELGTREKRASILKGQDTRAIITDALLFLLSFIFSRCQVLFGAHPLSLALLCALPSRIFISLAGAAIGALSLGRDGIVLALILAIAVFLRLAVSGGIRSQREGSRLSEGVLIKICVSVIGGFILSVYELLLYGLDKSGIFFSLIMIIGSPLITAVFIALFDSGISLQELISSKRQILKFRSSDDGERWRSVLFSGAALITVFFISLSLRYFELFGISLSYIFTSALTLLAARRLGSLAAGAVGFSAALALSHVHSAAFALSGLAAGALFGIGIPYALVGGCLALTAWSSFASGLNGFLSVFPEYIIGAALAYPLITRLKASETAELCEESIGSVKDMLGTMALAYQNRFDGALSRVDEALKECARLISAYSKSAGGAESLESQILRELEYAALLSGVGDLSGAELDALSESLAGRLRAGERISGDDLAGSLGSSGANEYTAGRIALLYARSKDVSSMPSVSESISLISSVLRTAKTRDELERGVDSDRSDALADTVTSSGLRGGMIRVFGDRMKHIILAGEDSDGTVITDPELKASLEKAINARLSGEEYYRRGELVLMECSAAPRYKISYASKSRSLIPDQPCGDSVVFTESPDGRSFLALSDGVGSGERAERVSVLVTELTKALTERGVGAESALHLANCAIRAEGEECSATFDLFEFDRLAGDACFLKCGAASSYVKRDSSIFRIRSRTAPIGLMRSPDAERVRVEVRCGDIVVMLSDGVNPTPDEAPWLLELLTRTDGEPEAIAEAIINAAERNSPPRDDMTAVVLKIESAA